MARRYVARTYAAEARKAWPDAEWIIGSGSFASVAYCDTTTVMLFRTLPEAEHAQTLINCLARGDAHVRRHEIITLKADAHAVGQHPG